MFRYLPNYLRKSGGRNDGRYIQRSLKSFLSSLNVTSGIRQSNLIVDGGNVVDNEMDKAILTSRIDSDNSRMTRQAVRKLQFTVDPPKWKMLGNMSNYKSFSPAELVSPTQIMHLGDTIILGRCNYPTNRFQQIRTRVFDVHKFYDLELSLFLKTFPKRWGKVKIGLVSRPYLLSQHFIFLILGSRGPR